MADTREVTVKITADTAQAESAIKQFKDTTKGASKAIDEQTEAAKRAKAELDAYNKRVSGGASAMLSFNQTIQDAPYGIMGVSNNITQFSQQFAYLSKEAGGAKEALKLMAQSLSGPMGVVFAISLATTALQIFTGQAHTAKDAVDDVQTALQGVLTLKNPLEAFKGGSNLQTLQASQSKSLGAINTYKAALRRINDEILKITASTKGMPLVSGAGPAARMEQLEEQKLNIETELKTYQTVYSEITASINSFKELQRIANVLDTVGLTRKPAKTPKTKTPKTTTPKTKTPKTKAEVPLIEQIQEAIETKELLNQLPKPEEFTKWFTDLNMAIGKTKPETKEFNNLKKFEIYLNDYAKLINKMRGIIAEEIPQAPLPKLNTQIELLPEVPKPKKSSEQLVGEAMKEWDKRDIKEAKEKARLYKDLFIDPFVQTFKSEFSKAWQSIFGEAHSLLEKFLASVSQSLLELGAKNLASSLLDFFVPGLGALISGVGDLFSGDSARPVTQIWIDGDLVATAKTATRTRAILSRQEALR